MKTTPINQSEADRLFRSFGEAYEAAQRGLSGPAIVELHRRRTVSPEHIALAVDQRMPLVGGVHQRMQLFERHLSHAQKGGAHP